MHSQDTLKKEVGRRAAELVKDGMLVGLGTGSTAKHFIDALIQRCRAGLNIEAVATSKRSELQAIEGGITMRPLPEVQVIDMTVDGADEIDANNNMIKGGGAALLREKIIAYASLEMVVVVDESKLSERLGSFPLPVEIVPFGHTLTQQHIEKLHLTPHLRMDGASPLVTDNGNYIVDIPFSAPIDNPKRLQDQLIQIPGVVETGLFLNMARKVLIATADGRIEIRS